MGSHISSNQYVEILWTVGEMQTVYINKTDEQTDRETDRQTDRQQAAETDRETDRQTDRETDRQQAAWFHDTIWAKGPDSIWRSDLYTCT